MSPTISPAVVRHAFALRGVDPAGNTWSPHDGAFRIPGPSGGHVRLVAVEHATTRSGWSYTCSIPGCGECETDSTHLHPLPRWWPADTFQRRTR